MIKKKSIVAVIILFVILTACNRKSDNSQTQTSAEEEKVQALKDVLKQAVDRAAYILSEENGFLKNDTLAISLPPEAEGLVNNIKRLPQGKEILNSVMVQINQVAGSTVEKMVPVLYAAIDSLPVQDINRILLADSAAATAYLEDIIRTPLQKACEPVILESLDKKMWGEVTPRDTWEGLIGNYNKLAGSGMGKIANLQPVEMILEEFVTEKMLDAIFFLMAREEMSIRKHPATKISKSLAKSLGWINDEK